MKAAVWTQEAVNSFNDILDYLLNTWTTKEAKVFIDLTDRIIHQIQENPSQFPTYKLQSDYRKAVITHQTTLFYQEHTNNIEIAYFWNTFQNPKKLSQKLEP